MATKNTTSTVTTLPDATAYAAASKSEKAEMRAAAKSAINAAIRDGDIAAAQSHMSTLDTYAPARPEKSEKDYGVMVASYVAALHAFADNIAAGVVAVPGTPDGFDFVAGTSSDPDMVTDMINTLSGVKPFRSANRSDIRSNIEQAFEDVASGDFMTFGDVARKMGLPSSGAVAAAAARGDFPDTLTLVARVGSTGAGFRVN